MNYAHNAHIKVLIMYNVVVYTSVQIQLNDINFSSHFVLEMKKCKFFL